DDSCYQDRLFLNVGGRFEYAPEALPRFLSSGSCVRAADYDRDGDLDLFVGGRVLPNEFPRPVSSYLLRNESTPERVRFSIANADAAPFLDDFGMVCDALWTDFDNDGWTDLLLAPEWQPLTFLQNRRGTFHDLTPQTGLAEHTGWWNSLAAADLDRDGDTDYLAGNFGRNSLFQASPETPVSIYAADFDGNGGLDAVPSVFFKATDGSLQEFPYFGRADMIKQMVAIKRRYPRYADFAVATIEDVLPPEQRREALQLRATWLESAWVENLGKGRFRLHPLPLDAQTAPVYALLAQDFTDDGRPDVLLVGNDYGVEVATGRCDALNGLLLENQGGGSFQSLSLQESGFVVPGDAKSLVALRSARDELLLIAGQNRGPLRAFQTRTPPARWLPLQPDEWAALLHHTDGRTERRELGYGTSFLSQSTRALPLPATVRRVEILDFRGGKRVWEAPAGGGSALGQ
ncbi:MAG: VCBS repeat-containing protein, partial [Bacteroidetes bacterium]